MANRENKTFRITGRVIDNTTLKGVAGMRVEAWDKDMICDDLVGSAVTDEQGAFQIEFTSSYFAELFLDRQPDFFFKVFREDKHIKSTEDSVLWNVAAGNTEVVIEIDIPAAGKPEEPFVVRGQVRFADGTPLAGALVRAYDKDLRSEEPLGDPGTTDNDGRYEIAYTAGQFARAEKQSADLIVRVDNPGGGEPTASSIIFNAQPEETVPLVVRGEGRSPSEYERLIAGLAPVVQDTPLYQLNEIEGGLENAIDFLAGDTGQDRQHITWLVQAAKLARETRSPAETTPGIETRMQISAPQASGIPAEAFYGWFRQGLPTELGALWATPTDTLVTTLKTAMEQRVIPSSISANLDGINKRIELIKLDLVLKAPGLATTASLGGLLGTLPAPLNLNQQRAIAAVVTDLRPEDPQLVDRITRISGFDGDPVAVARTLRLGALTGGHLPITQALQPRLEQETEGTLRPLAALRPDQWLDLAYTHGTPNEQAITPVAYADALAASIEQQHPTDALAAHLADGRRLAQQPALTDAGTFLGNNPGFNIVTTNLNVLLDEANLDGVTDHNQLVDGLRTIRHMNMLQVRWEEAAILLENGLHSPQKLLDAGPGQLTALLDGQVTPERVAEMHARAVDIQAVSIAAFTAAMSPLSAPKIMPQQNFGFDGGNVDPRNPRDSGDTGTIAPPASRGPIPDTTAPVGSVDLITLADAIKSRGGAFDPSKYRFPQPIGSAPIPDKMVQLDLGKKIHSQPTLQSLFGAQDACVCGHCRSVLSPAAYYVDLLQFLKNAGILGEVEGNGGLLARRPDIEDIELTCDNTNTEVPTIDLALEILENAIAFTPPLDVLLPPGTDIQAQLLKPVGKAVKDALETTVRSLSDDVVATQEGNAWTVVDGHRRWKLTAQNESGLRVERGTGSTETLNITGLNLSALVKALDDSSVSSESKDRFARVFAPKKKHPPGYANYEVTITQLEPGQSWRVEYRSVARLLIDTRANKLILQTPAGEIWSENIYSAQTIEAAQADLRNKKVPALVQTHFTQRFFNTGLLNLKKVDKGWTIESSLRELTLRFTPARLAITSLTYQSGDAKADALAEPENHNPAAYERLKEAIFPWSLPVDLPLEQVRLLLERAHSSRRLLIELMLPVDQSPDDDTTFTREVLGLSHAEAQLIEPPPPSDADIYANWGLGSNPTSILDAAAGQTMKGDPLTLLKNVSLLLQQSRLSFEALQAVIETKFVSASGKAPLQIVPSGTCKPSDMMLPKLTSAHLDRIHRFVRLQRRLGWTTQNLDTAIILIAGAGANPIAGAHINEEMLRGLAHLVRLSELLGLPIGKILALFDSTTPIDDRKRDLARSLRLSNGELKHASLLFDTAEPLANPGAALGFCDRVRKVSASGIAFEDLRYLLMHVETPGSNVDLDAKQLAHLAGRAYDAVRSILDAPAEPPLPAGSDPETVAAALKTCLANEDATRRKREEAIIAALATGLGAVRELVDDLLRTRLQHPSDPTQAAVKVFPSSLLLSVNDVKDVEVLIGKLRIGSTPIIRYLVRRLSPGQREVLMNSSASIQVLQYTLVEALNGLVQGSSIYEESSFSGVTLSVETLALIALNPSGAELALLNRKLLEEVFPKDIQQITRAIITILVRLHKSVFLCAALKLGAIDLRLLPQAALTTATNGFTALDFNSLPDVWIAKPTPADVASFKQLMMRFEQLMALSQLRSIDLQSTTPRATDLLHQYAALDPADTEYVQNIQHLLAMGLLGGDKVEQISEVNNAAAQLKIISAPEYLDPVALTKLIALLTALQLLGAKVKEAAELVKVSPTDSAAQTARKLLRSKYSDSIWYDLIKPLADKLRERQRDVLVDYLVTRDGLRSADDLYERYLIDAQMGSCTNTTRLLQATAAAQLFVQRVLLNLEDGLSLTDDKREMWGWMDRYRVWEANRKVFLFPENWLLPELRDDKTATFRQMESALTEQEPSPDVTHAALLGYVEELGDLAQISVIAMYQDWKIVDHDRGKDIRDCTLYVVGRTPDQPYRYFWRSCAHFGGDGMSWSGWESLDLDNANDYIMPFVFEGDLHVAWPIFQKTKKTDELLWNVQIAWTRRTHKGWTKRKISKEQLEVERLINKDAASSFVFRVSKADSTLVVDANSKNILTLEILKIHCYAANESAPKTMQPDPSLSNDNAPKAMRVFDRSQKNYWNVGCRVTVRVYEYAIVDDEGSEFSQPLKGVNVEMRYLRQDEGGTNHNIVQCLERRQTVVNGNAADGQVDFYFPADFSQQSNGLHGVMTGSKITLIFSSPARPGWEETRSLTLGSDTNGFYEIWTWDFTIGVENKDLKKMFLPGRGVEYCGAGTCIMESGRDLRLEHATGLRLLVSGQVPFHTTGKVVLDLSVDGNRFAETSTTVEPSVDGSQFADAPIDNISFGALNEGFLSPPPLIHLPVFVTRATHSPLPPRDSQPNALYLQDKEGGVYLQKQPDSWHRWADGQPFASTYRIAATLSSSSLFQPAIEAYVHVDPDANNFKRQFPYANYNWELFLHAPLAIAGYLVSQQRFEDARRWLHAVFDPTRQLTNGVPQFWRFLPFVNASQPDTIAEMLTWLADPNPNPGDSTDEKKRKADVLTDLKLQIKQWKANPFMPHLIARLRPSAYQWHTFFAYLDVLIGWGDQQFRRDTRESVNEATLLYVLAAKLLGPRPRVIPAPTPPPAQTYRSLTANNKDLDDLSNTWISYFDLPGIQISSSPERATTTAPLLISTGQAATTATRMGSNTGIVVAGVEKPTLAILTSLGSFAFCIPQNEKVNAYYDLIEKRLWDVRNCRNIDGVFRELPLFEPPIDPLLLIRARAAGLDIDSVIGGLYAPPSLYRFTFTLQKALELAAELKALGGALLAALEKQDAEELTLLRSTHELAMLKLVKDTRKQQQAEAAANIGALEQSKATVKERFDQYQKLLGKSGSTNGQDGLPVVEQSSALSVSTDPVGGVSGLGLSRREVDQFVLTAIAHQFTQAANSMHGMAGVLSIVPNVWAGAVFAGQTFGGSNLGNAASAIAKAIEMGAADASYLANQMGILGGYERRQDEWVHQSKLALAELKQIEKQILAAQIRKSIADHELDNHDTQIENAEKVDEFMRSKFTTRELYRWTSSQIAEVYFRTFQLALDQAKRAESTYQFELCLDTNTPSFIQNGYWNSLKKGLVAGEQLYYDLKRMEMAYLNQNKREFELTKHISLVLLNPLALVKLRETGKCSFDLPEEIFDLDYPGHYFRRIKSVSLTLPCVAGPYTTISCTLRLMKNSIRVKTTDGNKGYPRNTDGNGLPSEDSRFIENNIPVKAIAASNALNDSGIFELSFRDERYLPFEGAGAVSNWSLELFNDATSDFGKPLRQFDYKTISDAILHVKYTAREDAGAFKNGAVAHLRDYFRQDSAMHSLRMFNLRQEFPTQWQRFLNPTSPVTENIFELEMSAGLFPWRDTQKTLKINTIWLLARCTNVADYSVKFISPPLPPPTPPDQDTMRLTKEVQYGGLYFGQKNVKDGSPSVTIVPTAPPVTWKLQMTHLGGGNLEVEDVLLMLGYKSL